MYGRTGIRPKHLSDIEKGHKVRIFTLARLATGLGVSIDELINEQGIHEGPNGPSEESAHKAEKENNQIVAQKCIWLNMRKCTFGKFPYCYLSDSNKIIEI